MYSKLVAFFLDNREGLLSEPYRGNLSFIRFAYEHTLGAEILSSEFLDLLHTFNHLAATPLLFDVDLVTKSPKILWIDCASIETYQRIEEGKQEVAICSPNIETKLEVLLNRPLYTAERKIEGGFAFDLDRMHELLSKPTACTVLGIERARALTPHKPYFGVCSIRSHEQALTNICIGQKCLGHSLQDLPDNARMHRLVSSCKNILKKEIHACSKTKIHYLPLVTSSTDLSLGNCSYLDTCHKFKNCRYLHYYSLYPPCETKTPEPKLALDFTLGECIDTLVRPQLPPQWINCDVRKLPFSVLGKFAVVISDPAWDIHMSLPYGTCKDTELLTLPMSELQDEGILFLWVTGRSIEIGRRALAQWGYTISDEVIWVKLNQLQRTIVTGRTGHWLNHSKEHLIVGIKGNPQWLNRKIDLDIIVSGTRETLRKPDELYDIAERLVGTHARKLEIFGRDHNIRPGWVTIGNQLTGTKLHEKEMILKYEQYKKNLRS